MFNLIVWCLFVNIAVLFHAMTILNNIIYGIMLSASIFILVGLTTTVTDVNKMCGHRKDCLYYHRWGFPSFILFFALIPYLDLSLRIASNWNEILCMMTWYVLALGFSVYKYVFKTWENHRVE